jgi:hypothetical protein
MSLFQTLQSVREEMNWVLEEEGGSHFTVDIFNWMDRDMKTGEITPYFDVEINLYDEEGKRVDNWVTDIETRKLDAIRRSKEVLYLTKKWVANREQGLSLDIKIYYNRREVECYDKRKSNKRIKTNPSRKCPNDQGEKRVL